MQLPRSPAVPSSTHNPAPTHSLHRRARGRDGLQRGTAPHGTAIMALTPSALQILAARRDLVPIPSHFPIALQQRMSLPYCLSHNMVTSKESWQRGDLGVCLPQKPPRSLNAPSHVLCPGLSACTWLCAALPVLCRGQELRTDTKHCRTTVQPRGPHGKLTHAPGVLTCMCPSNGPSQRTPAARDKISGERNPWDQPSRLCPLVLCEPKCCHTLPCSPGLRRLNDT